MASETRTATRVDVTRWQWFFVTKDTSILRYTRAGRGQLLADDVLEEVAPEKTMNAVVAGGREESRDGVGDEDGDQDRRVVRRDRPSAGRARAIAPFPGSGDPGVGTQARPGARGVPRWRRRRGRRQGSSRGTPRRTPVGRRRPVGTQARPDAP